MNEGRTVVLARAVRADGSLNLSLTVARQLAGDRAFIPVQAIVAALRWGTRSGDPQGVAGHVLYRIGAARSGPWRTLEVLVHEASGQIRHVLYR